MCGIAGIYHTDPHRPVDRASVERMVAALSHRGPDGVGYHEAPGVCLGMCRLAIIDIEGGQQPMHAAGGQIAVVQNGEIYNHVELRDELRGQGYPPTTRSDTEVIAHLVERDGAGFAAALNGMFAVAAHDGRQHRLVLGRDRLGKKPLYLYEDAGTVVFASELRALIASGLVPVEVDDEALWDLLSYNYVPGERTLLRGVRLLPPGNTLTVEPGRRTCESYWSPLPAAPDTRDEAMLTDELGALIEDAVRLRLRADVPVGIFLSGGVDSAAIAWAASRIQPGAISTYTVSFPGDSSDEAAAAAVTAGALGLPHEVIEAGADLLTRWPEVVEHAGQPHGDASFMAVYELSRVASRSLRVALSGDGSDEVLGGYSWHAGAGGTPLPVDRDSLRARWEQNSVFTTEEKSALLPTVGAASTDSFAHFARAIEECDGLDSPSRHAWADVRILLHGNNLPKVDRMGMAHSLELRSPFLDYRLVEFALRVPGSLKVGPEGDKLLLRRLLGRHLPHAVAGRPKHLFRVPVDRWLASGGPATPLLDRLLDEPAALTQRLDPAVLRRLVDEHRSGAADHTRQLRLLIAIDLWSRAYLEVAA